MAREAEIRYINCYISGSAAYQVESTPLPKKNKVQLPKPKRRKKLVLYIDPVAILGIFVACVMFILMIAGAARLSTVQKEAMQMERYAATLQAQNQQLRDTYEAGFDLEEIRQIAQARGMVEADRAQQVQIQLNVPQQEQMPSAWENFLTFLTGLFA